MICMEERADKSDLSWNEVLELIWEQTEKASDINTKSMNNKSNVHVTKHEIQPNKTYNTNKSDFGLNIHSDMIPS